MRKAEGEKKMQTLKGRVLLGWMPRDKAVQFLLNECVFDPPLNAVGAEAMWQTYRGRVDTLTNRTYATAANLGLSLPEVAHAKRFRAFVASC